MGNSQKKPLGRYSGEELASARARKSAPLHDGPVFCVSVADSYLITGGEDKVVKVYDLEHDMLLQTWRGHDREVQRCEFSRSANLAFTASRDRTLRAWRKGQERPVETFEGHELPVMGLACSQESKQHICSGARDYMVKLWDASTGQCVNTQTISRNVVTYMRWIEKEDNVVQTSEDKRLRVWDTRTMRVATDLPSGDQIQHCCDVSPDGNFILTSDNGFDGVGCQLTVWDRRLGKPMQYLKGLVQSAASCCFGVWDGRLLAAGACADGKLSVWDAQTGTPLVSAFAPGSGPLTSVAMGPACRLFTSTFNRGTLVWKLDLSPPSLQLVTAL
eukprot:Colp12_sorted_trinity150504_noHs@15394